MSELLEKQMRFARRIAEFAVWVFEQGLALTEGESWRSPEQAALDAAKGTGIAHSLHTERLAKDFNLWRLNDAGVWEWLDKGTEPEWELLGAHWESIGPDHCWGGRFRPRPDFDHFSITHEGIR